ncbi:MAG: DUF3108 domain-containing protein [bacterium]|nr:DUF3108 domain-containing protein [bacterium]
MRIELGDFGSIEKGRIMNRGRRKFIWQMLLFAGSLLRPRLSFPALSSPVSPSKGPEGIKEGLEGFLDEEPYYNIALLWFKKAATGSFKLTRQGEGYMAMLEVETRGFIGFLTSYRHHIYRSHMNYHPDEGKLRVHLFERHVTIGKRVERTLTRLDNDLRVIEGRFFEQGELVKVVNEPIPEGVDYEDILSAYYNVRLGGYGPLEEGRNFQIRTIPSEGESLISVDIASRDETINWRRKLKIATDEKVIAATVRMPRKIFESKTGEVQALFNEAIIPLEGVVKDYIGYGDMRCTLIEEKSPLDVPVIRRG